MILPKGTVIKVSHRDSIIRSAQGIVIRSRSQYNTEKGKSIEWDVIEDPSGWGKPRAYYRPVLQYDKIISMPEAKENASLVLDRWDKE